MPIKVLIVCNRDSYTNPYVPTLADGLIATGCDVTCSIKEFWNNATSYDVIHIQWPNLLVNDMGENGESLKKCLKILKEKHIPIVATLHNLVPHYNNAPGIMLAYELIFKNVDCFIHLGEASIDLLKQEWPSVNALHVVIPHHIYDSLYDMELDKLESRKKLRIPENSKCILCFGAFRNDEERKLVINLSKKMDDSYYFLIPGFFVPSHRAKNIIIKLKVAVKTIWYSFLAWKNNLHISLRFVSDEELPVYLNSADLLVVQRLRILNSGNVSLAMFAGLPVVGPDVGNVGWILKKTGNACFDCNHLDALPQIIEDILGRKELGFLNKEYARNEFSTSIVAKKTKEIYEMIITKTLENTVSSRV